MTYFAKTKKKLIPHLKKIQTKIVLCIHTYIDTHGKFA